MRAIGEKSSNSPRSESRASVSKGDEEGWSGSHVTAVMMRSVGDTVGPFIYMGSRRAFDRGWGRETRREKERGRAHRWPLESGHAVMRRKRPLLALPLPSSPFTPPLHGFATLSRRDNGRWRNSPVTRARARARVRLPRAIASSLRSHPGTIAMTQSSRVAGTLRCRYSCRNRKCAIGRLSMYVWRSRNPSRQEEGRFFQSTLLRSSSLRSRTARPHILWILRVFYVWKCHSPVQVIIFSCNRDITSIYRVLCSPLLAHEWIRLCKQRETFGILLGIALTTNTKFKSFVLIFWILLLDLRALSLLVEVIKVTRKKSCEGRLHVEFIVEWNGISLHACSACVCMYLSRQDTWIQSNPA